MSDLLFKNKSKSLSPAHSPGEGAAQDMNTRSGGGAPQGATLQAANHGTHVFFS